MLGSHCIPHCEHFMCFKSTQDTVDKAEASSSCEMIVRSPLWQVLALVALQGGSNSQLAVLTRAAWLRASTDPHW